MDPSGRPVSTRGTGCERGPREPHRHQGGRQSRDGDPVCDRHVALLPSRGGERWTCPKPGVRALDPGLRKQGAQPSGGGVIRDLPAAHRRRAGYSPGVTMFTRRPGICTTLRGARPLRWACTRSLASARRSISSGAVSGATDQPVPQLAVDLHRQLDHLGDDQRRVEGGPRLLVDAVRLAAPRPQLLADMRRHRRQQQEQRLDRLGVGVGPGQAVVTRAAQGVRQLHHPGERRVEMELGVVLTRPP